MIALVRYISQSSQYARRVAFAMIRDGQVMVNGVVVTDPLYQVKANDRVRAGKYTVKKVNREYILLNKPAGYIASTSDEEGRATVIDLVKNASKHRLYPVGRLDKDTTGLLLLTNDGVFAQQLSHPKFAVSKVYHVVLKTPLLHDHLMIMRKGITLADGRLKPDSVNYGRDPRHRNVLVTLHSGKYRVIRRMFEKFGYEVVALDRVRYAGFSKKGLQVGRWRRLTPFEMKQVLNIGAKPGTEQETQEKQQQA